MTVTLQVPLQIVVRNMRHSEELEAQIRRKAGKLGEFHPRIVSCRVTVEQSGKHQRQGRDFRAGLEVRLPGRPPLTVTREHAEEPQVALREAFDAMTRQLDELAHAQEGAAQGRAAAPD